jgi:hypothetical protein
VPLVVFLIATVYTVSFDGFTTTRQFQTILFGVRELLGTGAGTSVLLYAVGLVAFVFTFTLGSWVVEPTRSGSCGSTLSQMAGLLPLHSGFIESQSLPLLAVITIAALGTAVLLGLAIGGFVRRQSRPYLLIVAALVVLLGRSAVAGFTITGLFSTTEHHFVEHGLDVVLVALVIAAVYHSRTVSTEADFDS